MVKGKRKTAISAKPKPGDAGVKDKEAKENKHGKAATCQGQTTISSCLNVKQHRSPLQKSPLQENNSATSTAPRDTNKQGANELNTSKQEKHTLVQIRDPNEQTAVPPDSGARQHTQSGQGPNSKKSKGRKVKGNDSEQNRKVTDFFPIRRSCRKSKAELKCEEHQHIEDLIKNNVEEGLKVKYIEGKGRGVFADRAFQRGQFVVEYHGELLEIDDAKEKESQYAQDPTTGCYMFYFRYLDKSYCVDATKETSRLGRLINHRKNGNLQPKIHDMNGEPHLIFLASRDLKVDEELLYDYGDRSKEATAAHPWLKH
ncbi:lysine methyltransferase 5Ab [Triplophysa rosa]|uniref:lysine methyltransferase 5Ab n=1 Tax=Triplophysa rosa TaxID=992332 RepID=UPI002545C088|nr:lysine methyltransferase 5Ab [Triplophysa rosa]